MPWRLTHIPSQQTGSEDLTDEEMLAVVLTVRDHSKQPFDETNLVFCAYIKIATVAGEFCAPRTEGKEGATAEDTLVEGERYYVDKSSFQHK